MKLNIFSLYDEKARNYNTPQYLAHKGEAIRMLQSTLDNKETMFAKYPEDFSLYCLGTFDDNNGKFEGKPEPELVIRATELLAIKSSPETVTTV